MHSPHFHPFALLPFHSFTLLPFYPFTLSLFYLFTLSPFYFFTFLLFHPFTFLFRVIRTIRVLLNLQQQSPPDSFVSIRVLRVLPLSAFESNYSPLFWRGVGGEAFFKFIQVHTFRLSHFYPFPKKKRPLFLVLFIQNT